jgi:hypothetical protein
MEIEVVLTRDTVERLIREFSPIRIHMTPTDEDRRWVELDEPQEVTLVPERGVRVICAGRVRYEVLGLKPSITLRNIQVLLEPRVVGGPRGSQLEFEINIEEADLVHVPGLVDDAIVHAVNAALTPQDTHMIVDFATLLTHTFAMPERLEPLKSFRLEVLGGSVHVDAEVLRFRVRLRAELERYKPRPTG